MRGLLLVLLAALCLTGCTAGQAEGASSQPEPHVSAMAPADGSQEPEPQEPDLHTQARNILNTLSREQILGQVFFVRSPGDGETAVRWAREYHLGGYILFGRDFKEQTPDSVRGAIAAFQQACSLPMLVAVDEEGGTVVRASRYPAFRAEPFPSPQNLFAAGGLEAVEADAREKSTFLRNLGINVNLAPVCDVSTDPACFIYDRTFGQDAAATAGYVEVVTGAMKGQSMGSVLKHFPGYGDNVDTHTDIAVDKRPLEQFLQEDLLPFRAGVRAGAGGVLLSHNIVTCLDETLPASLSPAAYRLLREEVGFAGVAMTDDLDMEAVAAYVQEGRAVPQALAAGADMVLTSDPEGQLQQVRQALQEGRLSWERLEEAALRVLIWKLELGLMAP